MNHPDPTAETLPNVQEPNPFTCTVDIREGERGIHEVWFTLTNDDMWWVCEEFMFGFNTKANADTHAALILAALHQAVME